MNQHVAEPGQALEGQDEVRRETSVTAEAADRPGVVFEPLAAARREFPGDVDHPLAHGEQREEDVVVEGQVLFQRLAPRRPRAQSAQVVEVAPQFGQPLHEEGHGRAIAWSLMLRMRHRSAGGRGSRPGFPPGRPRRSPGTRLRPGNAQGSIRSPCHAWAQRSTGARPGLSAGRSSPRVHVPRGSAGRNSPARLTRVPRQDLARGAWARSPGARCGLTRSVGRTLRSTVRPRAGALPGQKAGSVSVA